MGMFFPMDDEKLPDGRRKGFARYRQVLERDWKQMLLIDFISLAFFIPYGLGVSYAVYTQSILVLVPVSVLGGMIAGQGIAVMYDFILRRARDSEIDFWFAFRKSLPQNLKSALLPGAIEGLYLGFLIFSGWMMWVGKTITWIGMAIFALATLIFTMLMSVWWPQIVLFSQRPIAQLKNCVLFIIENPKRMLLTSAAQVAWWTVAFLLLPWSAFLVPFLGIWYITLVAVLGIYDRLNASFRIEEQIRQHFPGQIPDGEGERDGAEG